MFSIYNHNIWNNKPSEYRNGLTRSMVRDCDADICTFQECGPETNRMGETPIQELMSDVYTEVGPGQSNFTPVFFKTEKFTLIDSGYFGYDGKNDVNSKSVTWAVLEEKETKKRFGVAATHFWWMWHAEEDFEQRLKNAEQLKVLCDEILAKYDVPIIIGGDFNNGINSPQGDGAYHKMVAEGFVDVRHLADETTDAYTVAFDLENPNPLYPTLTEDGKYINGYKSTMTIDFIFLYGKDNVHFSKFDVRADGTSLNASDHRPLIAHFEIL